jgi:hypothetical protein
VLVCWYVWHDFLLKQRNKHAVYVAVYVPFFTPKDAQNMEFDCTNSINDCSRVRSTSNKNIRNKINIFSIPSLLLEHRNMLQSRCSMRLHALRKIDTRFLPDFRASSLAIRQYLMVPTTGHVDFEVCEQKMTYRTPALQNGTCPTLYAVPLLMPNIATTSSEPV